MSYILLPVIIPFATALLALILGAPSFLRRWILLGSCLIQLGLGIFLVSQTYDGAVLAFSSGNWRPPLGITIVVDLLSAIMLALTGVIMLASFVYGYSEQSVRLEHPLRWPLIMFIATGMNLSFTTGDLFNLFVAFEIMLTAAYAMLTLEADDWDIKQTFPYVAINLVASMLFLTLAGLAYSLFGTLNFAQIAERSSELQHDPRLTIIGVLVLLVAGVKAGVFPLYFWLPNSYPTMAAPVVAFYAGMLTKVGVYMMLRMYGTVLPHTLDFVYTTLLWLAVPTMLLGVIGAFSRNFIRAILPFHSLSQVGFMVLALSFFTPFGFAASIFFMIHHSLVKSSLFLVGGTVFCLNGTDDLERTGNLWRLTPWLGVIFLLQALSLAGIPPLSGFWAKYMVIVEGLSQGHYIMVAAAVATGVLTTLSMLKIWLGAFWREDPEQTVNLHDRRWPRLTLATLIPVSLAVAMGLGANFFIDLVQRAANVVWDRQAYIDAVLALGGKGGGL